MQRNCVHQVVNGGGLEALALDTAGRVLKPSYGHRVALHESGHFLIAYLLGWLPRAYTLSSLDAFRTCGAAACESDDPGRLCAVLLRKSLPAS